MMENKLDTLIRNTALFSEPALPTDRKTATLVDAVEDTIVRYIEDNNLKAGDPMPFENDLMRMLGVGRNVVREALSRLKSRGILTSRKHKGMEICEPEICKEMDKAVIPQLLSKKVLVDLLELRFTLEIGIIPTLFSRVTDEDIADLESMLEEMKSGGVKLPVDFEQSFHSRIYAICQNDVLINLQRILIPIFKYINENYDDFSELSSKVKDMKKQASHEDLVMGLKSGDRDKYLEMLKQHLLPYSLYVEMFRGGR